MKNIKNSIQKQSDDSNHSIRDLIIVILIALLAAFFIWRYFDYKIEKIKYNMIIIYEHFMPLNFIRAFQSAYKLN